MDERELNRAISQAKSNVGKKLQRIQKRERFSDPVIRALDPRRNESIIHMSREQKVEFLTSLRKFTSKSTNFYRDADGNPITESQWRSYKKAEAQANAFVQKDIKKFGKLKLPFGSETNPYEPRGTLSIAEAQALKSPRAGRLMVNPSGSGMFLTNRKPSDVVMGNIESLIESLERRTQEGYIPTKLMQGRDQFEKMVSAIGDNELIEQARNLSDDQFWALWNYTNIASDVSIPYSMLMEGLRSGANKDIYAGIANSTMTNAHRYVEWASQI